MTTKNLIQQRVECIPLDQILELPYEQQPSQKFVDELVKRFDERKLGTPVVSLRLGVYRLIDGYHRVAALREMGAPDALFWVLDGLTYNEEIDLRINAIYGYQKNKKIGGNKMVIGNIVLTEKGGNAAPAANVAANGGTNTAANITMSKRKAPVQRIELIALDRLVETEYQWATSNKQVNEIVTAFDEDRLDPLVVAEFGDVYHIIDGLHRSRVMKIMEYTHAYARILSGLTFEQAAELFRSQNDGKRQISTFDEFRAGVIAKNPMCLTIKKIVEANKFYIGRGSSNFYCLESVKALTFIAKTYGYDVLDDTLALLRATWSGIAKASQKDYLLGVAEFVKRYGTCDFAERLKDRFQAVQYDYIEAVNDASKAHASIPGGARQKFCQILVKYYNKGLGSNSKKRLVWEGVEDED